MNKKILGFTLASLLAPALVFAQLATSQPKTLSSLIDTVIGYANQILVLMMGIAVVMFVYYIIKFFIKADAERKEAGPYVMWSMIGFFVILSMWGLVNVLQNTFGLGNETNAPKNWADYKSIFPGGSSSTNNQRGNIGGTDLGGR